MALEYVVESLDKVSDDLKSAYVEAEGKFNFDPDKYAELKAEGLKKKNGELLGKLKIKDGELGKFAKFKSLAELMAEADETEIEEFQTNWQKRGDKNKGKTTDDADKLEMKEKLHAREVKKLADELGKTSAEFQKAQAELKDYKLWTPLRDIAIKAGLDPQDWEVARLELSHQQRFGFDEDGKVVVMEDGQPSTVSPEKFFKEVYSDLRPKFYKASGAAGSGATNNTAGAHGQKTMKRADFDARSPTEKMAFVKANGELID